ncbi:MAG: phosphopentomutase [Candidatus Izemoplasmatales bacterium]|nr:phosphopentomutase [bacterium]MDZ4195682.1 phosphopentomutase [Candidatus Izemoplasmatales bacterium]
MLYKRIFLIVMDSVGVGAMPDADKFGDVGANTIGNLSIKAGGIHLPTLKSFGFGNLTPILGVSPVEEPRAYALKLAELSNGKDTMTGHWEIMGIKTEVPFQTFTDTGFPPELISELETRTGRKVIGNIAASGTEILVDLGPEHMKTGAMIVYTSADSVLQIAAHEEVIDLDELYQVCEIAREITMKPEWMVGRIIARPFLGDEVQGFKRTTNRHDYALSPTEFTVLDYLKEARYDVISVGKINDIFNGSGITDHHKIISNHHGMEITTQLAQTDFTGLCFVNLVDFDALYGHRRDSIGYKNALEEFDADIASLLPILKDDDLLMITADHGNDPTHVGSDHTREYVPLLIYNKILRGGILPTGETFADIAATIAQNFKVSQTAYGVSLIPHLR